MPLLFCGPMETHSSWTGIHLQCWPWSYAIHSCCRPDVELTSYLLLGKECQCHCFLPPGLPQGFLLLSHDWYVRRSSCKPPHEYRGQIHPGRSCGYWWNILLTSMIKFSHLLWEKWASWMEFCTSLTPFIPPSPYFIRLGFNFYIWPAYVEHNLRPIVLGIVCLYCEKNIKCGIFFKFVLELLGDLVLMMAAWRAQYLLLLCKLSHTAWSSMWLQDQWPSILWVRQDLKS